MTENQWLSSNCSWLVTFRCCTDDKQSCTAGWYSCVKMLWRQDVVRNEEYFESNQCWVWAAGTFEISNSSPQFFKVLIRKVVPNISENCSRFLSLTVFCLFMMLRSGLCWFRPPAAGLLVVPVAEHRSLSVAGCWGSLSRCRMNCGLIGCLPAGVGDGEECAWTSQYSGDHHLWLNPNLVSELQLQTCEEPPARLLQMSTWSRKSAETHLSEFNSTALIH